MNTHKLAELMRIQRRLKEIYLKSDSVSLRKRIKEAMLWNGKVIRFMINEYLYDLRRES